MCPPDLAIKRLADSGCGGDVFIPWPGNHNLCVAVTNIAVPHLHMGNQEVGHMALTCGVCSSGFGSHGFDLWTVHQWVWVTWL